MTELTVLVLLSYVLLINAFTWLLFWYDKRLAKQRRRRISEHNLLFLCLVGGTIGAFFARRKFRHKTRKQPFVFLMKLILAGQFLIIGLLVFAFLHGYLS
ncbi:MAG: DUF1294 domain-containing protein [Paracoccaceae bacterium]